MSGADVSGWHFLAFVVGWTIVCCLIGYVVDKLAIKLGFWRLP